MDSAAIIIGQYMNIRQRIGVCSYIWTNKKGKKGILGGDRAVLSVAIIYPMTGHQQHRKLGLL